MEQGDCVRVTEVATFDPETTSPSRKEITDPVAGAIIHCSNCGFVTPLQAKSESVTMENDARIEQAGVSTTPQETEKLKSVQVSDESEEKVTMKESEQARLIDKATKKKRAEKKSTESPKSAPRVHRDYCCHDPEHCGSPRPIVHHRSCCGSKVRYRYPLPPAKFKHNEIAASIRYIVNYPAQIDETGLDMLQRRRHIELA